MALFFNGRLYKTPAVISRVDTAALANRNLTVGNVLAILGAAPALKPKTPHRFGGPSDAREAGVEGEVLKAIELAFDPSAQTGGPSEIVFLNPQPSTQSALALLDAGAATVITLTSTGYGLKTRQIKVKVESATNTGKKLTTQYGDSYYVADDVYRHAFSIQYTGAEASARMTINNTTLTLEAPNSTVVATIDLSAYDTVQKLVDRINVTAGFGAAVLDGNGAKPALGGLDSVSNQDVKTAPYTVAAHLQAIVDWFNGLSEGFVTATRAAGSGTVPANIGFTYLAGGVDGTLANQDWTDTFTKLQEEDVQWVVPIATSSAIHAMADAHCAYMSTVGRKERRAICGTALGTTDANAIAAAKAIGSDRTALVHLGIYSYNESGVLTLYSPHVAAAAIGGGAAGVNPGTPLTNKTLKVSGLERKLRNPTDTDLLIDGGVIPLEDTPQGYKIVKSITTWLTDDNYYRTEMSVGAAGDFVARNLRNALEPLVGAKASPITMADAQARAEGALRELARPEPSGPEVLVGDAANPPWRNLRIALEGDVMRVEVEVNLVLPVNYIPIVVYARPYSGLVTA